ncbi:hypothetical protein [Lentibacillus juripiscarius]|uniref:Sigma-X negative effector n=1 Tax=Lentibacillus juripiscarius TaxID=257446 RepID=A0ABW5V9Z0_9BACI
MKKWNNSEEQLKETLKQMPRIHDNLDKDALFQRISSKRRHVHGRNKEKRFALMPVLASVMALGLVLILVPLMLNDGVIQNAGEDANHALDRAITGKEDDNANVMKDTAENEETPHTYSQQDKAPESLVMHSADNEPSVIHGAVADLQGQYVIPLSLVVPDTADKNDYLNELGRHLQEDRWGTSSYVFGDTTFQLDEANQQVKADFPEKFPIAEEGSSGPNMLQKLLASMFRPYQVEKVVFNKEISLGKIGTVQQLPLKTRKNVYKTYQSEEGSRKFLIEIPIDEQADFQTAIAEMKKDEEAFHVSRTVPESAELSVSDEGRELRISFDPGNTVPHGQDLVTMIDAILMTAKNFGYDQVMFLNTGQKQVGPYDLTSPLSVPPGANPITPAA